MKIDPFVLRKVADIFGWDQILLFQLAGYLDSQLEPKSASSEAQFAAYCFDLLSKSQQNKLLAELNTMMASGATLAKEQIQHLEESVHHLRERYPVLAEYPFGFRKEIGRIIGNITRTSTRDIFLRNVLERVNGTLENSADKVLRNQFERVLKHPHVNIIWNLLLPRHEIPAGLEKLYWILHDPDTPGTRTERLSHQYRDAIRTLCLLLKQTASISNE